MCGKKYERERRNKAPPPTPYSPRRGVMSYLMTGRLNVHLPDVLPARSFLCVKYKNFPIVSLCISHTPGVEIRSQTVSVFFIIPALSFPLEVEINYYSYNNLSLVKNTNADVKKD